MDKLNRLFAGNPREFAAAFRAATSDEDTEVSQLEATLWLEDGTATTGAGFVWGHGQIHFRGNSHAFRLSGSSRADLNASGILAAGSVTGLRKLTDFNGNYSLWAAGAAGNGSATYLKNERGVVINLIATAGLPFDLPVSSVRLRLKQ
jgi:hypothetical protein